MVKMGLYHSPGVVTDSLVFYYDMSNTAKSYLGEPTTNQFAIPTPDGNGNVSFAVNGTGTFKRIFAGSFGGYDIQPSDIVYRYDLGANGCHYHGNDVTITAGQYPTFTFDYYLSPDVSGFSDTYMANFENLGSGVGGSAALPNLSKGVWQTIQINGNQASSTSGLRMLLYPGGCSGSRLAATGFILMKNPQVTFNSTSGKVLPFVAGTRSNTGALLDLSGQNVITAQSLTYNSDNTFSFNGSNNYLSIPDNALIRPASGYITTEIWFKSTSTGGQNASILINKENEYEISAGGGFISYAFRPNWAWVGATAYNLNQIYCVTITYDQSYQRMYLNGAEVYSAALTGAIGNVYSDTLKIGARGGAASTYDYFPGSIYNVKIYNRGLTPSEVQQNFNALRGRYSI